MCLLLHASREISCCQVAASSCSDIVRRFLTGATLPDASGPGFRCPQSSSHTKKLMLSSAQDPDMNPGLESGSDEQREPWLRSGPHAVENNGGPTASLKEARL